MRPINEVKKSNEIYVVNGYSILKDNEVGFSGTIRPIHAFKYLEEGLDMPEVVIVSEYEFNELDEGDGTFIGTLASSCHYTSDSLYLDTRSVSAEYRNNTYVGVWTNSDKNQTYKCVWGRGRLPYTYDFDIGTSEPYVNEKYRKYGWEDMDWVF